MTIAELGRLAYSFRGSVHYHHDWEHDCMQADMVLKQTVLLLAGKRKSTDCYTEGSLRGRPQSPLPQWHSSSSKAIPPHSTTPFGGCSLSKHQTDVTHPAFNEWGCYAGDMASLSTCTDISWWPSWLLSAYYIPGAVPRTLHEAAGAFDKSTHNDQCLLTIKN